MASLTLAAVLSGCSGLIYEVLWIRQLTAVFGHTAWSVATVSAAFMAGLASGSWAADRLIRRCPRSLIRIYAAAEAGIAAYGFFSKSILAAIEPLSVPSFPAFFLVLAPPTFLMGLTLPVLVARFEREEGSSEKALAHFYGWNTLGATAGCLLGGIWLPPRLGVSAALRLAALGNAAAAAVAFGARDSLGAPPRVAQSREARIGLVTTLAFLSGVLAMICETSWFRMLQLLLGSSTQTISLVLAYILLGLGLGGLTHRLLAESGGRTESGWALVQAALAAAVLAQLALFDRFFYWGAFLLARPEFSYGTRLAAEAVFCGALILAPSVLMGLSLPWLWEIRGREDGRGVGRFYAANALGCVTGSLLAGFVLLPRIGVESCLIAAVAGYGLLAAASGRRQRPPWALAAALAVLAAALAKPRWSPNVLSSGMFVYGGFLRNVSGFQEFKTRLSSRNMLYHEDGISATVSVLGEADGKRILRVNGKTDASSHNDLLNQYIMGYIPLFFHPRARRALVIGLGSGATAGALARSRALESLEVVEIEPKVKAASDFFKVENHFVLDDPRVSLSFGDGRHYLRTAPAPYDIIASEPSNPWIAGIASLYTREHWAMALERLAPNGVFAQWFQAYSMSPDDVRMVLATFAEVFPRVMLFSNRPTSDFILIGARDWPADLDGMGSFLEKNPGAAADLARFGFDWAPSLLAASYVFEDERWRSYAGGAALNTDDKPLLEFNAPRSLHVNLIREIHEDLEAFRTREYPAFMEAADWFPGKTTMIERTGRACFGFRDLGRAMRLLQKERQEGAKSRGRKGSPLPASPARIRG